MYAGIAISDFRSIGEEQMIAPLGKINLFVGPNNAGKSNILRFINQSLTRFGNSLRSGGERDLTSQPHTRRGKATSARLGLSLTANELKTVLKPSSAHTTKAIAVLHAKLAEDGILWINEGWPNRALILSASKWLESYVWHDLYAQATAVTGGHDTDTWIPAILKRLKMLIPHTSVHCIPIDRRAGSDSEADDAQVLSGRSVIRTLAAMQAPGAANFDEERAKFRAIEEFLRLVVDDGSAALSVTYKQDEIIVQFKGQKHFPLADLGSGVEQVILHAVVATAFTDAIITFEEPELHLHPILQRQLIKYLARTSNQYFISTHSAHLIDALHAQTFHVRLVDGQTIIQEAKTDAQRHAVCADLGYRASDIVQANCVIWVEGPSDRNYIRHWLAQVDPHLEEHVHYSIMFYGGKLLSHLSVGETDTVEDGLNDLIELRLLNRQLAVVMDSDLSAAGNPLRPAKERVKKEVEASGGLVWVTAGREIENYIPRGTLSNAVESVHQGRGNSVKSGRYVKVLPTTKKKMTVDKVKVSNKVTELGCGLDALDLQERMHEMSDFVRRANGLPLRLTK